MGKFYLAFKREFERAWRELKTRSIYHKAVEAFDKAMERLFDEVLFSDVFTSDMYFRGEGWGEAKKFIALAVKDNKLYAVEVLIYVRPKSGPRIVSAVEYRPTVDDLKHIIRRMSDIYYEEEIVKELLRRGFVSEEIARRLLS